MLKLIGVELSLFQTLTCVFLLKKLRECVFLIFFKYVARPFKYIKSYDDSRPSKYITYLDSDNLYGCAISQYLLYSGFKWLNQKEGDGLM